MTQPAAARPRPWRRNVLALIGAGYVVVLAIFVGLCLTGSTAGDALDAVANPLMALVGGSLALAKDLVNLDRDDDARDG